MTKPELVVDGRDFSTLDGFYEVVGRVLVPGGTWGRNLDAFNDILRGGSGTPDGGFVLRWRCSAESAERLGYAETVLELEHRLLRCYPASRSAVEAELERARRGVGPTVFDWLVEIIRDHGSGGSEPSGQVELVLE